MTIACYKDYTINVGTGAQAYWTMDGPNPLDQIDSVASYHMPRLVGNPPDFTIAAGIVNNGQQMQPSGIFDDELAIENEPGLKYNGTGFTLALWMKFTDLVATPNASFMLVTYVFDQNGVYHTLALSRGLTTAYAWRLYLDGIAYVTKPAVAGGWHFFAVTYNGATNTLGFDIDQAGMTFAFSGIMAAGLNTTGDITLHVFTTGGAGNELRGQFDEVSLFSQVLTPAQLNYLYNGGAGRTWPIALP